jgi:predicted TIM-barrel fold metal-dependent hydrolase
MIFDCNAYLGNFFSRQIRNNTAPELLAVMDENEIDRAVVGSLSAIMYRNCQMGNEELAAEIADYRDRLVPFAVINPAYADWEYDLDWCVNEMGTRGVRAYPQYHSYGVLDPCCKELVQACGERKLPVTFFGRQEDYRQSHQKVDAPDLALNDLAQLCSEFPQVNFMILEAIGHSGSRFVTEADTLPKNSYIEFSRGGVDELVSALGVERVIFGTGIPMKYPGPAFVCMELLEASDEVKQQIFGENLAKLLGV